MSDYLCSKCGKNYRKKESGAIVMCLVAHPPNSCCHIDETELPTPPQERTTK